MQRHLNKSVMLLGLLLSLLSFSSCGGGPKVEVCILYPDDSLFYCYDAETKKAREFDLSKRTKPHMCLNPEDYERVLNACKMKDKEPQTSVSMSLSNMGV